MLVGLRCAVAVPWRGLAPGELPKHVHVSCPPSNALCAAPFQAPAALVAPLPPSPPASCRAPPTSQLALCSSVAPALATATATDNDLLPRQRSATFPAAPSPGPLPLPLPPPSPPAQQVVPRHSPPPPTRPAGCLGIAAQTALASNTFASLPEPPLRCPSAFAWLSPARAPVQAPAGMPAAPPSSLPPPPPVRTAASNLENTTQISPNTTAPTQVRLVSTPSARFADDPVPSASAGSRNTGGSDDDVDTAKALLRHSACNGSATAAPTPAAVPATLPTPPGASASPTLALRERATMADNSTSAAAAAAALKRWAAEEGNDEEDHGHRNGAAGSPRGTEGSPPSASGAELFAGAYTQQVHASNAAGDVPASETSLRAHDEVCESMHALVTSPTAIYLPPPASPTPAAMAALPGAVASLSNEMLAAGHAHVPVAPVQDPRTATATAPARRLHPGACLAPSPGCYPPVGFALNLASSSASAASPPLPAAVEVAVAGVSSPGTTRRRKALACAVSATGVLRQGPPLAEARVVALARTPLPPDLAHLSAGASSIPAPESPSLSARQGLRRGTGLAAPAVPVVDTVSVRAAAVDCADTTGNCAGTVRAGVEGPATSWVRSLRR